MDEKAATGSLEKVSLNESNWSVKTPYVRLLVGELMVRWLVGLSEFPKRTPGSYSSIVILERFFLNINFFYISLRLLHRKNRF